MAVEVKICGLKTHEALEAAIGAGADYIGLVFYPRSPRNIDLTTAAALSRAGAGRVSRVALLVDPDDAMVRTVIDVVSPDVLQLHGAETPDRVRRIKDLCGLSIMKALRVATEDDVAAAVDYLGAADSLLFDAKPPPDHANALPGGNGVPFDWQILGKWTGRWYMLSGGLTPANVAAAIRLTGAPAVDVSSGVERAPGEKDARLISDFVRAAKAA